MLTPYQFASNTPIQAIDLDGLEAYYAADGSRLGQVGSSDMIMIVDSELLSKEQAKALIATANSDSKGWMSASNEIFDKSTILRYEVGSKDAKAKGAVTGITGNSFRTNHPLYDQRMEITKRFAMEYTAPVYESHLLDMTDEFNEVLEDNKEFFAPTPTGPWKLWFGYYVTDNSDYDLKINSRDNLDEISSFAAIVIGEWSLYDGVLTRYDDYGNISYGFWGKIYGFDRKTLIEGANDNQDTKNGKTTTGVGDEKRDTDMINKGVDMVPKL